MSKKILTTIELDSELHQRIKIYCARSGRKMREFYSSALSAYLLIYENHQNKIEKNPPTINENDTI